jgi:hypothetical protein
VEALQITHFLLLLKEVVAVLLLLAWEALVEIVRVVKQVQITRATVVAEQPLSLVPLMV